MTTLPQSAINPDGLARRLFLMTMLGAAVFFIVVVVLTHFVPEDVGPTPDTTQPLVHFLPNR